MQFTIPVNTLKALLVIAAKGDRRYWLNGVCVDVRERDAAAIATDGHKLIALQLQLDAGPTPRTVGRYIIPREVLENLKGSRVQPDVTVTIDAGAQTVRIVGGNMATVTAALVAGEYPDWRRVVPLTASGEAAQFSAAYIADFGKAHKLLGGKYSPAIMHNGTSAARVLLPDDAVGVLMPLRLDIPSMLETPAWARSLPAVAAAA